MVPKAERRGPNPGSGRALVGVPQRKVERYWCVDHRVEFDVGDRAHALCELSTDLPSLRKLRVTTTTAARDERVIRHTSGYRSVDRVFGGGLARGSCSLVTGKAGVGKSTLLIQILMNVANAGGVAVYLSGEETRAQVVERALAIGPIPPNLHIIATKSWEKALASIELLRPHIIVVDSIQRLATIRMGAEGRGGNPGTHAQVLAMAGAMLHLCKEHRSCWSPIVIAVGHLNAAGDAAGPEAARHDLDAHFHLTKGPTGEIILMSGKNRYGASGEMSLWRFQGKRMIELPDLSTSLLDGVLGGPGAVAFPSAHLARIVVAPVESVVSALPTGDDKDSGPRIWRATGSLSDPALRDLLDMLRTHADIDCGARNVRVEVPRIADVDLNDPALEAAVCCAILSSAEERVPSATAYFGKFSVTGKIRPADRVWDRMVACAQLGIRRVVGPPVDGGVPSTPPGVTYVAVPDVKTMIADFRRESPVRIDPRRTYVTPAAEAAAAAADPFTAPLAAEPAAPSAIPAIGA